MDRNFVHVVVLPVNGGFALIDASDYGLVCGYEWYVRGGYIAAKRDSQHVFMHRLVLGLQQARTPSVDHINHLRFDNRRCNLRACTHAENQRNQSKQRRGTSIYKGVTLKGEKYWYARITLDKKKRYLGSFPTETDAAKAYDEAAVELFGEFANLNFPHLRTTYEANIAARSIPKEKVAEPVKDVAPRYDRRHDRKRVYRPPVGLEHLAYT